MSFQISLELDANKVFLVRSSELEGRLDPNFYHPKRKNAVSKLKKSPFRRERLSSIVSFEKSVVSDLVDNNIYIGLENIESNTGAFIDSGKKESISTAFSFKIGHVLFPKLRPYLNKVFYADFNGICSTEFHVLNSSVLDNKYLFIFLGLNIVVNQTSFLMSGNTLPRLQTEDIKNLLVPIPPLEIQSAIVAKMDAAYASKREKEAEAQRLLDSIDDYLLGELGIELPEQEENTVQSRIFTQRFSEISGDRLDPDFHSPVYKRYEYLLCNSPFEIKKLSEISVRIFQGVGRKLTDTDKYTLLKVKNILKNNEIDFQNIEFVDIDDEGKLLNIGDIISPFIGEAIKQYKFSVYNHHGNCTVDNNTGVIRLKSGVANPIFVSAVMMSSIGKWQLNQLTGGGGVPFLGSFHAKRLRIPLPPLSIQNEIADHITQIRSRAKQLQQEAKEGLEQAKREVESMLLGDA